MPPRSSVTPHTIAAVFSSSNSGDGDGDADADADADADGNDWLTSVEESAVETSSSGEVERMSTR